MTVGQVSLLSPPFPGANSTVTSPCLHPKHSPPPSTHPPSLHLRHFLAGPEQQQQLEPERIVEKKRKSDLDDYFTIPPLIRSVLLRFTFCPTSLLLTKSVKHPRKHGRIPQHTHTHTHTHTHSRFTPLSQFCGFLRQHDVSLQIVV